MHLIGLILLNHRKVDYYFRKQGMTLHLICLRVRVQLQLSPVAVFTPPAMSQSLSPNGTREKTSCTVCRPAQRSFSGKHRPPATFGGRPYARFPVHQCQEWFTGVDLGLFNIERCL